MGYYNTNKIAYKDMAFFRTQLFSYFTLLLFLSSSTHAYSQQNIYMMTLSVLSYVKWNTPSPTLCIIDDASASISFNQLFNQQKFNFKSQDIRISEFSHTKCDAVFFSRGSAQLEQKTLNAALNQSTLSFSSNNPDCEIGSTFCFYTTKTGITRFKVNLDSLSKTKIHIDPRVLLLAQNAE